MSKRRSVGDIVQIQNDEGRLVSARILGQDRGESFDDCARSFMGQCDDESCKEWLTLAILDNQRRPTGEHTYHISECEMKDPAGKSA